MAEQWESLMEDSMQELRGHLKLDCVMINRSGTEITVCFSSDILVEERPFLTLRRALRKNLAPIQVSLVVKSPQLAQDFLDDPMKYASFILRSVKRHHPSAAPAFGKRQLQRKGAAEGGGTDRRRQRRGHYDFSLIFLQLSVAF